MAIQERPVDRRSLPEQVAARLHERIASGEYPGGSRLPQQRELAAAFGVSMAAMREAIALLASAGLVASRHGDGTFVADQPAATLRFPVWVREPNGHDGFLEAIEARDVIERAMARLAAARRNDADLGRLKEALDGMRRNATDADAFGAFDFAFHLALSDAAGNRLLAGTLAALHGLVRDMIALYTEAAVAEGRIEALIAAHAELAVAVEGRRSDDAARIIGEMMERLRVEAGRRVA
jgi:GntR family transcriptional repressor for pyruvate dehydrogenase complex